MTFTSGPQSQPIRFQSQQQLVSVNLFFFLIPSTYLVSPVGTHIHSKLSIKTAAIPCSRLRVFSLVILPPLSALHCSINDTSHAFASRTGILSRTRVQIRKAKFKVVQKKRPRSVDISMKTQCPSLLPSSHLYSTSVGSSSATLLIYPPSIAFLPSVLGTSQFISHCPPWAVFLVPGMSSLMIPV